jgi:hypothetical protein
MMRKPQQASQRHVSDARTGTPWPTPATTPARCKPTSATRIFGKPFVTPNSHLIASSPFGGHRSCSIRAAEISIHLVLSGVKLSARPGRKRVLIKSSCRQRGWLVQRTLMLCSAERLMFWIEVDKKNSQSWIGLLVGVPQIRVVAPTISLADIARCIALA